MESETEPLDNGVTEIHTLDVGQADAHLVVTDEGELILIDANVEELDEKIDTALSGRKVEQTASEKIPLTDNRREQRQANSPLNSTSRRLRSTNTCIKPKRST